MEFNNKVAIISGGSTGIGKATADLLAQEGCKVYVFDINAVKNSKNIVFLKCDVRDNEQIKKSVNYVLEKESRIDLLFANAGVHFGGNIENTTLDKFDEVFSTNVRGVFCTLKAVLPIMKKQNSGNIVIMGSDQSFIGKANSSVYGLTKGALGQLTKSTAIDYAPYNIRVNCICPGTIDTPLYRNAVGISSSKHNLPKDDIYKKVENAQPIKRIGTPKEVANAVAFLLSDKSSFMTGSLLSIDGGYTAQ